MARRIGSIAGVVCVFLIIAGPTLAGQKGSGSSIPVTATFRNNCFWQGWEGFEFPCVEPPDRIGSDPNGDWPFPYTNGVNEVRAIIDAAGEFVLDTNTNTGRINRSLYVDFRASDPPEAGLPHHKNWEALGYGWVDAYVITAGGGFTAMRYGDAARWVGLAVNFPYWSVHFGYLPSETDTDRVRVTCVGPAGPGKPCELWDIEALADTTAKLLLVSRKGQTEDYGNYFMPFKVTVRRLTP
jgi:hypothetical protein